MPPQDLEDAARVLQGRVGARVPGQPSPSGAERRGVVEVTDRLVTGSPGGLGIVPPALRVVLFSFGVEAGEEPLEILGVLKFLGDQRRRVGVGRDILLEISLFFQDITDQTAQEDNVGPRAKGCQQRPNTEPLSQSQLSHSAIT